MRVILAQLAPARGDVAANLARLEAVVRAHPGDLAVFPELFLSGYRVGDRIHGLALTAGDGRIAALERLAGSGTAVAVGAPVALPERRGEVANSVLLCAPGAPTFRQVKRYLPTFGPFEEGSWFTPSPTSVPARVGDRAVGLEICYDAFFPEVSRELALGGAELLVVVSASPVTSRRLFEKVLPARAVENGLPLVYVNRVGVEDGVVFGGGSVALDSRGEPLEARPLDVPGLGDQESVALVELDLDEAARFRPFRPVLRDLASRPPPAREPVRPAGEGGSSRTDAL